MWTLHIGRQVQIIVFQLICQKHWTYNKIQHQVLLYFYLCNLKLNNILGIYFNESSYISFHILSTIYSTVISAYILFIFIFTFSILLKGYESDTYKQPLEVYNFTYRKLLYFLGIILLTIAILLFMILFIIFIGIYLITEHRGVKPTFFEFFFEFFFWFVKAFPEMLYNLYKGYQSYQ